jgi:hypothetical protein
MTGESQLLTRICELAQELSRSKGGVGTLRAILKLRAPSEEAQEGDRADPERGEILANSTCVIAQALEGRAAAVLVRVYLLLAPLLLSCGAVCLTVTPSCINTVPSCIPVPV